jgi:nucleotide-binding universal stress UspA family protein
MKIKPAKQPGHVVVELSNSDSERLSKSTDQINRAASPFKLKKILVPIDFSDCSKKALQYAIPFAKQFHARMIFLHVLPTHHAIGREAEFAGTLIDGDLKNELEAQLTTLVQEIVPSEIPMEIEVRHGAPSMEIVNAAKEMGVDVIVMSTHGHTGRVHAFIGSVAGDVVRLAPCPVLVVREHEHEFVQSQSNPFKPSAVSVTAV